MDLALENKNANQRASQMTCGFFHNLWIYLWIYKSQNSESHKWSVDSPTTCRFGFECARAKTV